MTCNRLGSFAPHAYVCSDCFRDIPIRTSSPCIGCGGISADAQTCNSCRNLHAIDSLYAVSDYAAAPLRLLIKIIKYDYVSSALPSLGFLIEQGLKQRAKVNKPPLWSPDTVIVPVPLHPHRLKWRGFNQSEYLARSIADRFLLKLDCEILIRIASTPPQAEIADPNERIQNVGDCFRVRTPSAISEKHILLIDDVCTTGATLNACAQELKKTGASKVSAIVVARG